MIKYVRLVPYDKKAGALCRRLTVGGMLFKESNWYELDESSAAKLSSLRQESGAPYFEIVDTAEAWREIVRRELAAAMGGPQAAALAELFTTTPDRAPEPKKAGEVLQSSFGNLKAAEVSPRAAAIAAASDLSPKPASSELVPASVPAEKAEEPAPAMRRVPGPDRDPAPEPEPRAATVDLDSMTKRELLELADDLGVEIDSKARKADVLEAVRAAS